MHMVNSQVYSGFFVARLALFASIFSRNPGKPVVCLRNEQQLGRVGPSNLEF